MIFHSDLDHTLIYSCRCDIGREKKCVEIYEGREVSYMTHRSLALLKQIKDLVVFVPTTTRTEEQYHRICLGIGEVEYALVCNGGILLRNGQEDISWYQESLQSIQTCRQELERAEYGLTKDPDRNFEVRNIRDLFLFTKSAEPSRSVARLKTILNLSLVDVFCNGSKVYVLPRQLNKGAAVRRFAEKIKKGTVIAAGDSVFDIPMLHTADVAFAPEALLKEAACQEQVIGIEEAGVFSDAMLLHVLHIVKNEKERIYYG